MGCASTTQTFDMNGNVREWTGTIKASAATLLPGKLNGPVDRVPDPHVTLSGPLGGRVGGIHVQRSSC
jgi:hypothetical protein